MDKIIQILNNILDTNISEGDYDSNLNSFEKWDSLTHLRIISEIEGELNIEFDYDDINRIEKVSDFFEYTNKNG